MNYYETLGVDKNATPEDIKKAHRKKAKNNHPDNGGNKDDFIKTQLAYEVLIDEDKRKRYDNNEPEPMSINEEAIDFVLMMLESVITDVEEKLLYVDFVKNMKLPIKEEMGTATKQMKKAGKQISLLIKLKKGITFKGKGKNLLLIRIEREMVNLKEFIKLKSRKIKVCKLALIIVEDYSFSPEKRPAVEEYSYPLSSTFDRKFSL